MEKEEIHYQLGRYSKPEYIRIHGIDSYKRNKELIDSLDGKLCDRYVGWEECLKRGENIWSAVYFFRLLPQAGLSFMAEQHVNEESKAGAGDCVVLIDET